MVRREEAEGAWTCHTSSCLGLILGAGSSNSSRFPQNKPDYCLRKDDSQFPPREIDKAGTTPPRVL